MIRGMEVIEGSQSQLCDTAVRLVSCTGEGAPLTDQSHHSESRRPISDFGHRCTGECAFVSDRLSRECRSRSAPCLANLVSTVINVDHGM